MSNALRRRSRRFTILAVFSLVALSACVPPSSPITPVLGDPGPPAVTGVTPTLTAVNSPMWQTDGAVWALAYHAGKLFAGGEFTFLRAPGTAAGDTTHPATRLAAFNTADGTPDSTFNHTADGRVAAEAVSPDGRTLYVGGLFAFVDGKAHPRVAAFDLTTAGYPLLPWNPAVAGGGVRAIAVSADSSKVFLGGDFTGLGTPLVAQPGVAEVGAADGVPVASWKPVIDGSVDALLVAPGSNDLIVGGNFEHSNGAHLRALTSIDMATGGNGPIDPLIKTANCGNACGTRSDIKALATDGTTVYVGSEGTGGGWFDGTLAFNPLTGHQVWVDNCLGATQAIAIVGGVLYDGSHAHDCSAIGGFGQLPITSGPTSGAVAGTPSWHHLMGEQASNGKLLDWFPTTNPGPTNGVAANELGPRAMATDGTSLFLGGQFTKVNGVGQQGVTRFMAGTARAKPVAVTTAFGSLRAGRAVFDFIGTTDPDSSTLSYKVYRDGNFTTPIAAIGAKWAHFWNAPLYQARDVNVTAGRHSYVVDAIDESGNATRSAPFIVSVPGPGYQASVLLSRPSAFWRLNERTGTLAADSSGHANAGTYSGGMNRGIPGAVPSGPAIHLGSNGNVYSNAAAATAPNTFALAVWFRTTSTTGGRIIGFGNKQTGVSTAYDRMFYMTNAGQLIFGTFNGALTSNQLAYLWSPKSYNDGTWHFAVAEMDQTGGMQLYVDGVRIAFNGSRKIGQVTSGWWRVGPDAIGSWPLRPTSPGINADIDEVSIYPNPLAGQTMRNQMTAE